MPRQTLLPFLSLLTLAWLPAEEAASAAAVEVPAASATAAPATAAPATAAPAATAPVVVTRTVVRMVEQPAPPTSARWPWFAAGAIAGLALGVAVGALAGRRRKR
jgi:hypothetical protein